ncbi:heparan-alpha-glucosaminide N-acetyltransferase isoform X2 [Megalopta genalis]|uniref:heparan-alpha-glucosaminide N-acetyltransferase isoform X2 n=1 Tax=Megalopta genalis TaxID=115081 RepID=UPI001442EE40|nr:heparan-alpha-glucosaminide N-acetyltransferase-like isoform X2 [Megalopta genalis]
MDVLDDSSYQCSDTNKTLEIDEACFNIVNLYNATVRFYSVAWEAYWGNGKLQAVLEPRSTTGVIISTKHPLHIYYQVKEPGSNYLDYCHETYNFEEHGSYGWNISAEHLCSHIYVIREPTKNYLPIIAAIMIYILVALVWSISKVIIRVIKGKLSPNNPLNISDLERLQESESVTFPTIRTTKSSTRIHSVDTFRGIAVLLMIFVNNGGGEYVWFNHSAWFGLTIADLVLPWFAWIMGLTIAISKRAELRITTSRIKIALRCLVRSLILILFGLMLNSIRNGRVKSLGDLRFPGVLQLLAITYFVCATLELIFMKPHSQFGRFASFHDILDNWPQWLIVTGIVATHTLITFLLPVPNCPRGYFGPGGELDHRGKYMNCTAGAAGYIDRLIFGNHIYNKTSDAVYGTILPYDPEGLMNTISAIFIVYLGVHAGKILLLFYQHNYRIIRWVVWAMITGLIAGILCNFERQEGVIPISKKMMSLSFVLSTSSLAFLLFAFLYFLIDYRQFWTGAPFVYAGSNPIFLYVGHILTKSLFPWSWYISYRTHGTLLAMNLWTTMLWALVAYLLHRKDIIITV